MPSKELEARAPDGALVTFEPDQARTMVTAFDAHAKAAERRGEIDVAVESAQRALAIQRAFVIWWDGQTKDKGAAMKRGDRSVTALAKLPPDMDKKTVSRWRQKLSSDALFEAAIEAVAVKVRRAVEGKAESAHVESNSGEDEWYTPEVWLEIARAAMGGIDVDPASSKIANERVGAPMYFDKQSNGLEKEWRGRVWMNPPYSQPLIGQFISKLSEEFNAERCSQYVVLVNNATDTAWGQLLLSMADAVLFPRGRIQFWDKAGNPGGSPLQGQMLVYGGASPVPFQRAAAQLAPGAVLVPLLP